MRVSAGSAYLLEGVSRFDARGLQRCAVPGVSAGSTTAAVADFWKHRDGTLKLRIVWMGYDWSFEARLASGAPIPDDDASMDNFAWFVSEELHWWMTEDAADLPPFDDN